MELLSAQEAASLLGVNVARVRALADRRFLRATKIGRDLVFDRADVLEFRRLRRARGRPLSARNAWALVALMAGEEPTWAKRSSKDRLKARLHDAEWVTQALGGSEPRSAVHRWELPAGDVRRLAGSPRLVATGVGAATDWTDLLPPERGEIDAYLEEEALESFIRELRPTGVPARPNVVLRVPDVDWVLRHTGQAPASVIAADLLDHPSERVRREGHALISKLVAE